MSRKIRRTLTAVGAGLALAAATASPASAHDIAIYHGSDMGAVTRHNVVSVLDRECDGHAVYLQYDVSTIGGVVRYTLYDSNGCGNSGSTRDHYPQQVTVARICEVGEGCGPWTYT